MRRTSPSVWWCLAGTATLALYVSAPYVTEIQTLLRQTFQDYFDTIFTTTVLVLGLALLVSGIWVELKREKAKVAGGKPTPQLRKIALKQLALSGLCAALYYVGLTYVLAASPSKGVRIIEFIHLFEYSLVTALVLKAISTTLSGRAVYVVGALVMFLVGLGDEAVQGYLARRVGEFRDVLTNVVVIGLALVSVALVFSPPRLTGRTLRQHKGVILALAAVVVSATALFIDVFHIGYRIQDDRCGVFYSLFPKDELLRRSNSATLGPNLPTGASLSTAKVRGYWAPEDFYATEARKHKAERDIFLQEQKYWQAFCEEQMRRLYYRQYADQGNWASWTFARMREQFGDFDAASFTSYHHDLVFRDWNRWYVWLAGFCACIILLVVGIVLRDTRGFDAHY